MVDVEEVTLEADPLVPGIPQQGEGLNLMPALTTFLQVVAGKVIFSEEVIVRNGSGQ